MWIKYHFILKWSQSILTCSIGLPILFIIILMHISKIFPTLLNLDSIACDYKALSQIFDQSADGNVFMALVTAHQKLSHFDMVTFDLRHTGDLAFNSAILALVLEALYLDFLNIFSVRFPACINL